MGLCENEHIYILVGEVHPWVATWPVVEQQTAKRTLEVLWHRSEPLSVEAFQMHQKVRFCSIGKFHGTEPGPSCTSGPRAFPLHQKDGNQQSLSRSVAITTGRTVPTHKSLQWENNFHHPVLVNKVEPILEGICHQIHQKIGNINDGSLHRKVWPKYWSHPVWHVPQVIHRSNTWALQRRSSRPTWGVETLANSRGDMRTRSLLQSRRSRGPCMVERKKKGNNRKKKYKTWLKRQ